MTRALVLVLALALAVAAGLVSGAGPSATAQAPSDKPNLLVVMTDDLETNDLKALPSVRRLAQQGTTFSNSFVGYSLCCPSRATYLTGQYNHNNGVLSNAPPDGGYARLDGANTLPVWLQKAGYHTTHVGKYLNGYESPSAHTTVPPGYSDWQGLAIGTYRMYDYSINDNGTLVPYGTDPADYQTDVLANRAVAAIRERAPSPQPFYLKFSPLAPHGSGPSPGTTARGRIPRRATAARSPASRWTSAPPTTRRTCATSRRRSGGCRGSARRRGRASTPATGGGWPHCWPSTRRSLAWSPSSAPPASSTTRSSSSRPTTAGRRANTGWCRARSACTSRRSGCR